MKERKKKVVKRKLKKISLIALLSILIFITFLVFIIQLDVLPAIYLIIAVILLSIIQILAIFLLFSKKKIAKGIGIFVLIVSMVVHSAGIYYLYNTNHFLNHSFGNKYVVSSNVFYVVTSSTTGFSEDNIEGAVAYFKNTHSIDEANKKLKSIYVDASPTSYDDMSAMFRDVLEHKIGFMLVEEVSYKSVFDFDKDLKKEDFVILDKIEITSKKKLSNEVKDAFNIYIGGTDFTDNCMDFNMIVTVNIKTNRIVLTSIPRDYYIEVAGYNGAKDKLSFMTPYGIDTISSSLENLFGIQIDYYIKLNTTSLVEVVDQVGGITFCSDTSYYTTHAMVLDTYDDTKGKKLYVKKGCQEVNGIQALTIARERNFPGRDRVRQENCRKIMLAIINKLNNVNTLTNYTNLLNSIGNLYETTIPKEIISKTVKAALDKMGSWKIEEQSVNGDDTKDYIRFTNYKDWVMYPNMDTVTQAAKKINRIINH